MMIHSGGHVTPMGPLQASHKPKVGLAVICRCCSGNSYVQCLLQKRGPMSSSPDKWSFPGGRLEQPGDLEDDGAVGTKRELEEECGGGEPPGLPPLIHIECCKSGKLRQTLYHVYVVDTSVNKEWEHWQPKLKNGKSADIDTSPQSLTIQDQMFPCVEGYCWVDMSVLIQECYNLNTTADVSASQLQHGLVRWVQNYGEHILKTLIARSPKLPHPRRYSNSMIPGAGLIAGSGPVASALNGHGGTNGASAVGAIVGRPPRAPNLGGRMNKFGSSRVGEGGMLVPPTYLPATSFRPPPAAYPILGSPTNIYYGMVPTLPPTAAALGQMSPTGASATGGGGSGTVPTAGYPTAAAVGHPGLLVQVPPPPSLAVVSTMGGPTLDSSTSALIAAAAQQQQQQTQGQSAHQNVLYMQPLGIQQQQQLQGQVTLSGSPIQQKDFTHPSSPVGFKAPPPIAAIAGDGPGGGGGSGEESSVSLMGSIHQQPSAAHLVQTQGLVTMTPIMAPTASPSSSLHLGGGGHGMQHHLQQHHHQQVHVSSSQQQQQQQAAAAIAAQLQAHMSAAAAVSSSSIGGASGIFEHLQAQQQQQQQAVRPVVALPSSAYQEHSAALPLQQQHQQQQPPLMAQFHHYHHHHPGIVSTTGAGGGGEGISSGGVVGTTTGTGANLPLMPPPSVQPLSGMGIGQRSESEPLLPNPPIPPLHPAKHVTSVAAGTGGSGYGGGASSSSGGHGGGSGHNQSSRKEIPCKHFLAGTCPFGEKCWFAHLQPIQRGGGDGGGDASRISSQLSSAASGGPLHVQIPHNLWINNPNMLFDFSRFVASPPQSPLNSTLLSAAASGGAGARPPILPTLVRPRAYYPNFPGQQPLLLVRPPGGTTATVFPTAAAAAAGGMGVGVGVQGMGGYPFFHTGQYPSLQPQVNPILKFNLLSEVTIKQQVENQEMVVTNIAKMITRADHFYVAYGQLIHDYKILFGGNRSFQESAVLIERKVISAAVSCLHFSKHQPTLMIIGTVFGSIYTWDVRKGAAGGVVTSAHTPETQLPGQQPSSITVLIHFATSINSAQVIVAGNKGGHVTWFISQPPQKNYSVLYCDQTSHGSHPIVALQILGGFLITGDRGGRVILWSMQTQQPVVDSKMVAHSISLCNIHVVDSTRFITIGLSSYAEVPDERLVTESTSSGNGGRGRINEGGGVKGLTSGLESIAMTMDDVASEFSQMTVGGLPSSEEHTAAGTVGGSASEAVKTAAHHPDFFISIWEFNRPPKLVHSLPVNGVVISSSFNYHLPTGNMFLATGLQNGTVKIYNVPLPTFMTLTTASELHFSEMMGKDCIHVAINLSREVPLNANAYIRNPFRDLILTTVWSDGRIMVCQVARQ